jgi:hypothetical protein
MVQQSTEKPMTPIHIQFTRFSAFYSPLISTMSGGFLAAEGLEATHSIAAPGKSAIDALVAGTAQVVQSALSQGLTSLEKGEQPAAVHFAQINEKDGFFLTARAGSRFPLGQIAWPQGAGGSRWAAARHVQVRVPQDGARLCRHRCAGCRQWRRHGRGFPGRRR